MLTPAISAALSQKDFPLDCQIFHLSAFCTHGGTTAKPTTAGTQGKQCQHGRNLLFQDTRTALKNNAISSCTYSGNAFLHVSHLTTSPNPCNANSYTFWKLKIFKSTKHLQTGHCSPRPSSQTSSRTVSVSWAEAPNTVTMHPHIIKTTVLFTKSPVLQNTHISCRWLTSRNI